MPWTTRKKGDQVCVYDKNGKEVGCFDSQEAADKRIQQLGYFAHKADLEDHYMDFVITKASIGPDGRKRWAAAVSKFAQDEQGDEVTRGMFERSIAKIEAGEHPMPALVISHYDDPRLDVAYQPVPEEFRAGTTEVLYIDGDTPKAKGYFENTPLGDATYEAVKADMDSDKPHEERIRISMAWRPEEGGVEKADDGHALHRKALIRHLATTRVPIVKETNIMVSKSEERQRTKLEDASTIVGEELASQLDSEYSKRLSRNKSDVEEGLIEKAGKEHMKNGKFDMGSCLTAKLGEGMKREQALAVCLKMGGMSKKKADLVDSEQIEKRGPAGRRPRGNRTYQRDEDGRFATTGSGGRSSGGSRVRARMGGGGPEDNPITRDQLPCISEWRDKGMSLAAARDMCNRLARRTSRTQLHEQVTGNKSKSEHSMSSEECVRMYVEDKGMSREDAVKHCDSEEANSMSDKSKSNLGDIIDMLVDELIARSAAEDDGEVQISKAVDAPVVEAEVEVESETQTESVLSNEVVEAASELFSEEALTDLLLDALNELSSPVEEASAEIESAIEDDIVAGESDEEAMVEETVAGDVNETPAKAAVSESPELEAIEKNYQLLKSALMDDNLDQSEKAVLFNHAVGEIGNVASEIISKKTPASPSDMATMLREVLSEVLGPIQAQNQLLINTVNTLQSEKAALEEKARVPQPKQLRHVGEPTEKAQVSNDNGGAMTAAQIAEASVRPSRMY